MKYPDLRIKHQRAQIVTADGSSSPYPLLAAQKAIDSGEYEISIHHRGWTVYERQREEQN
jgi:hypothetical protein